MWERREVSVRWCAVAAVEARGARPLPAAQGAVRARGAWAGAGHARAPVAMRPCRCRWDRSAGGAASRRRGHHARAPLASRMFAARLEVRRGRSLAVAPLPGPQRLARRNCRRPVHHSTHF